MKQTAGQTEWHYHDPSRASIRSLADACDESPLVATLLLNRGISSAPAATEFLAPLTAPLTPPSELTDMEAAVARIQKARDDGEHIRIFGDYDVDGISATAIMIRALEKYGIDRYSYALPSRLADGYGLNPANVQVAQRDGVNLIITVDNGIKAHEAAHEAHRQGIDLIVTDHHTLDDRLPEATAVINPRRESETSPLAPLCGAGVAAKLSEALNASFNDLDLAALGTVADLVPLSGENRALVARGLEQMRNDPKPGINALMRRAGVNAASVSAENIAFQLAPRINAGGRMGIAEVGLQLLLADNRDDAAIFAEQLQTANDERRRIDQEIYDQAVRILEERWDPARRSIVLGHDTWHVGVIGIVAARLLAAYHRPSVLVSFNADGLGRGSARSLPEYDLAARLEACADLLEQHGGHQAAAGFSIRRENMDAFKARFEEEIERAIPDEIPPRAICVDAIVSLNQIDSQLMTDINRLEPFGQANPPPILATHGAEIVADSLQELRGGHLRLSVRQGKRILTAIGFNMANSIIGHADARRADLAFTPKFNTWRGETTIQLQIKDIHFIR